MTTTNRTNSTSMCWKCNNCISMLELLAYENSPVSLRKFYLRQIYWNSCVDRAVNMNSVHWTLNTVSNNCLCRFLLCLPKRAPVILLAMYARATGESCWLSCKTSEVDNGRKMSLRITFLVCFFRSAACWCVTMADELWIGEVVEMRNGCDWLVVRDVNDMESTHFFFSQIK